jgi:hypothetical protein
VEACWVSKTIRNTASRSLYNVRTIRLKTIQDLDSDPDASDYSEGETPVSSATPQDIRSTFRRNLPRYRNAEGPIADDR